MTERTPFDDRLDWHPARRLRPRDPASATAPPIGDDDGDLIRLVSRLEDEARTLESERGSLQGLLEQARDTLGRLQTAREIAPKRWGNAPVEDVERLIARLESEANALEEERGALHSILEQARQTLQENQSRHSVPLSGANGQTKPIPSSLARPAPGGTPPADESRPSPAEPVEAAEANANRDQSESQPTRQTTHGARLRGRFLGTFAWTMVGMACAAMLVLAMFVQPGGGVSTAARAGVSIPAAVFSSRADLATAFGAPESEGAAAADSAAAEGGQSGATTTAEVEGGAGEPPDSAGSAPSESVAAAPDAGAPLQASSGYGDAEIAPTTEAPETPVAATSTATSETVPAAVASNATHMELRLGTLEPPSLDPGLAADSVSGQFVTHLFEGLVARSEDGAIEPRVAERWDVSADGLTYSFHLRDTARWSDGAPVVATDFVWAWQRTVDPASGSAYAAALSPLLNAEAILRGEMAPDTLGVLAVDERTLVVTLARPAVYFLDLASTWALMPLRQDVLARHGSAWTETANIVTNGPFLLREWSHDRQIVLERNDAYWGAPPSLGRATFRVYSDPRLALADYESGALDALGTAISLPVNAALSDRSREELSTYHQSGTFFLVLNTRRGPLQDARVRRALGMAVEREALIGQAVGPGHTAALGLQPEGIVGANAALWPAEDVGDARRLLADAGFPRGQGLPALRYAYNATQVHGQVAAYLRARWAETLGVKLEFLELSWAAFLGWPSTSGWQQEGDIYPGGGWASDYEDPSNWYNLLWDSASDPTQFNSGWRDESYDALVRQAVAETDPARRAAMYGEAEQILADAYPSIPLYHAGGQTLVKPYVHGLQPTRLLGILPLTTVTVDPH